MTRDFEDHCWKDIVSDEVLKLYEPYQRETYVGSSPALLAIDLYNSVYAGGDKPVIELHETYPGSCGSHAWEAIEPTKRLFAACRAAGLPVIYSTRDERTRSGKGGLTSTKRKRRSGIENPNGIFHAFSPTDDDLVIYKSRASVFHGTPLSAFLVELGVDSLIVCGESTSGCVRASVVDAYSHGYHVSVVEECCFDRSTLSHKVNLFDMHHKYADVMHLDEVVTHLDRMAV